MMQYNLPTPPALMGTEAQQLVQMRSYLFRISEMLNSAITEQHVVLEQTVQRQSESVSNDVFTEEIDAQYNKLKSLIIKTADIVRTEMDMVETELRQQYIAKSEWGTYQESIHSDIVATAESVVQSYDYDSQLAAARAGIADFEAYKIQTSGYIQSGIIGYDDDNYPVIGIAIGQDLKSREVTIGGEVFSEIDMTKNLATYTSERITFWQNGIEVAYISNSEMGITSVHIKGKITLGDEWEVSHTNGFTVKWVGGE